LEVYVSNHDDHCSANTVVCESQEPTKTVTDADERKQGID